MADFPAMPLWTDAYLADLHPTLTLEQHGCMLLLMQAAWRKDCARLADDDKWFCRFLNIHGNSWRRLKKQVLAVYWNRETVDGVTYWYQKRLRKEWEFVRKKIGKRKEMAEKRWAKHRENSRVADAKACAPTPTPTPIEDSVAKATDAKASSEQADIDPDAQLYRKGREVLGKNGGAMVTKLKRACGIERALGVLEVAQRKADPVAYVAAACHRKTAKQEQHDKVQTMIAEMFEDGHSPAH